MVRKTVGLGMLMGLVVAVGCGSSEAKPSPPVTTPASIEKASPPTAQAPPRTGSEPVSSGSIGWATISDDGTITLDLIAIGPNAVGEGRLVYPKSHPQYQAIAAHVGGIKPGERKPVAPWKD